MSVIPARRGRAVRLNCGQSLKITNTHGHQVVDFWAFSAEDLSEFLSMEHLRATLTSIFPKVGDDLVTNRRRAILRFVEDTSPGIHDTIMAACDDYRYGLLGCTEYH
ncbi:MAG: urea carboxylase-associated family protein, partial [Hyphomicrobiaceae bacterium]